MKTESKLAKAFLAIATQENALDSTASTVLAIVKDVRGLNGEKFDDLVKAAYDAAGWNTRPGRPDADAEKRGEVPATVRTYVTVIRRALRVGIRVSRFATFSALRVALAAKTVHEGGGRGGRRTAHANGVARIPKDLAQNFIGVAIEKPKDANGALFHDLASTYLALPEEHRNVLGRQLNALLVKYRPLAKLPVPVAERKAA